MNEELLQKSIDNQTKLIEELVATQAETRKRARLLFIGQAVKWVLILVMFLVFAKSLSNLTDFAEEISEETTKDHIGVLDINEPIMADAEFANFSVIAKKLDAMVKKTHLKAIVLSINSPGGSPVQASLIYNHIRKLKKQHPDLKIYSLIEDVGASGAYYIASSTDKIIANKYSIVGSIGVIMSRYNFTKALNYLNIERKTQKAGKYKDILDPSKPDQKFETDFMQTQLDDLHKQFIADVKAGRGKRLKFDKLSEDMMFSGLFWSGSQAMKYGLIDELGDIYTIKSELNDLEVINYTPTANVLDRLSKKVSVSLADSLSQKLEYNENITLK